MLSASMCSWCQRLPTADRTAANAALVRTSLIYGLQEMDRGTEGFVLRHRSGERVRLFVGNTGVSRISSFHVIGEVFDMVYPEASTRAARSW